MPRHTRLIVIGTAVAVIVAGLAVLLVRRGSGSGPRVATAGAPISGVFGSSSVWKQRVTDAPVSPGSAGMVAGLVNDVATRYGGIAAFNAFNYNTSYYTVPANTPRTRVIFDDCQHKGYTPSGLYGPGGQFTGVPIPSIAVPAMGTDRELTISEPATDQLWELWQTHHEADGWHACWGGRIDHASTSPGYFTGGFGASASGLVVAGGMIGIAETKAGRIQHAIGLAIPDPASYTHWVYPAQRSDGDNPSPSAIPEGARLRLSASVDIAALHLTPIAAAIARAAQTYGFIVTDSGGAVAVNTESGTPAQVATGVNPWTALLGVTPAYKELAGFPWGSLQVVAPPKP